MNKSITLRYGTSERTVTVPSNATVGTLLGDPTTKVMLGFGDNIHALISGVTQPLEAIPGDSSTLTIENRANAKALVITTTISLVG